MLFVFEQAAASNANKSVAKAEINPWTMSMSDQRVYDKVKYNGCTIILTHINIFSSLTSKKIDALKQYETSKIPPPPFKVLMSCKQH